MLMFVNCPNRLPQVAKSLMWKHLKRIYSSLIWNWPQTWLTRNASTLRVTKTWKTLTLMRKNWSISSSKPTVALMLTRRRYTCTSFERSMRWVDWGNSTGCSLTTEGSYWMLVTPRRAFLANTFKFARFLLPCLKMHGEQISWNFTRWHLLVATWKTWIS